MECPRCQEVVVPHYGMCPFCDDLIDPQNAHVPSPEPEGDSLD